MSATTNLLGLASFNNNSTKREDISIKLRVSYPATSYPQFHRRKIMDDALLGCKRAQSDSQSTTKPNSTLSMSDTQKQSNGRKTSRRTRMTDWEKMDDCMRYLRDEHRWTMEDLIHAYASTTTEKPFKASVKVRSRKLAEA